MTPELSGDHAVTLRDYVDRVFAEREKLMLEKFRSQRIALTLATRQLEDRLAELKAVRDQVAAERGLFITRETYAADRTRLDHVEGAFAVLPYVLGIPGIVAVVLEVARLFGFLK